MCVQMLYLPTHRAEISRQGKTERAYGKTVIIQVDTLNPLLLIAQELQ